VWHILWLLAARLRGKTDSSLYAIATNGGESSKMATEQDTKIP
jgi:hypothetical protein